MKDKKIYIKLIQCLTVIVLYHITGKNSLFLYAITLSLYNIFLSCFSHISIKDKLKELNNDYGKFKILKYTSLSIIIICLILILLSILISDITNMFLNIENTFLPYLIMSISIISEPLINLFLEYLESYNKPKLSNSLLNMYYIIENILFLIISILTIRIIKLPIYISISLLYLSKILSFIIIASIIYITLKKQNIKIIKKDEVKKINYKYEIKEILKNNTSKSIINIIKNSYYYISIIILYLVLSTRYSYNINTVEKDLTFVYLYGITLIKFLIDIVIYITKQNQKKENIINYIYRVFQNMITIAITIGVTSPLICKIFFLNPNNAIYLTMLISLSIFIILFDITFKNIKNNKIIYISLIVGIISKLILIIPLINSFYRMGYNLIYGDIISTIISISISIIINYIYLKIRNKQEKSLEKILTTLYESILLSIILILFQFIIPINTESYFKSIIILIIYISISIIFVKVKKKKRG
ncbi:MAG: hypothetical protein IJE89_04740 [Bacilli bacterium]|nr:hypothetical protein [Bacilli bacterium]